MQDGILSTCLLANTLDSKWNNLFFSAGKVCFLFREMQRGVVGCYWQQPAAHFRWILWAISSSFFQQPLVSSLLQTGRVLSLEDVYFPVTLIWAPSKSDEAGACVLRANSVTSYRDVFESGFVKLQTLALVTAMKRTPVCHLSLELFDFVCQSYIIVT